MDSPTDSFPSVTIARDWFDYATLVANIFAAVGTIAATGVAVYLSTKDRVKVKVSADLATILIGKDEQKELLTINVVNIRHRTARVEAISWKIKFIKGFLLQKIDYVPEFHGIFDMPQPPVVLNEADRITFCVRRKDFIDNGIHGIVDSISSLNKYLQYFAMRSVKICAFTSEGTVHQYPVSPLITELIRKELSSRKEKALAGGTKPEFDNRN
ncbi:MAG: hypothetical protein V4642_01270 [Bacteroidota bacterium]